VTPGIKPNDTVVEIKVTEETLLQAVGYALIRSLLSKLGRSELLGIKPNLEMKLPSNF
jgi:hypothetical protein